MKKPSLPVRQTKPIYDKTPPPSSGVKPFTGKPPTGKPMPPTNYILPTPIKTPKQQSLDAINRKLKG